MLCIHIHTKIHTHIHTHAHTHKYIYICIYVFYKICFNIQHCNATHIKDGTVHITEYKDMNKVTSYLYNCPNKNIINIHEEDERTNNINEIAYSLYVGLELSRNNISKVNYLNFIKLINLTYIDISHNNIKYIGTNVFKFNKKLQIIYLNNNRITIFDLNLSDLKSISLLSIDNNIIKTMKIDVFRHFLSRSNILNISANIITCDCSIYWIRQLEEITSNISTLSTDICTLAIHKQVSVHCFINKDTCNTSISATLCTQGKLFVYIYIYILIVILI